MEGSSSPADETTAGQVDPQNTPSITEPQRLAFTAFAIFVVLALIAGDRGFIWDQISLSNEEYAELAKFTAFLIAALLPSDWAVRAGRTVVFRSLKGAGAAKEAGEACPATTTAQRYAFRAWLVVAAVAVISNDWISDSEGEQIIDVATVLVVALLPSDAALRVARSLHLRGAERLGRSQAQRI